MAKVVLEIIKNKKFWLILFLSLVFIFAAIYVYNTYVKPRMNASYVANKEYIQKQESSGSGKSADLYFFFTTWCPHCKTAKPIWEKLKEQTTSVHGVTINYVEVDCEKDPTLAEKYKVEGYPTIKLAYNNKVIEFDAKPDLDILNQFLNQSIN